MYCELCEISIRDKNDFEKHIKSEKHLMKAEIKELKQMFEKEKKLHEEEKEKLLKEVAFKHKEEKEKFLKEATSKSFDHLRTHKKEVTHQIEHSNLSTIDSIHHCKSDFHNSLTKTMKEARANLNLNENCDYCKEFLGMYQIYKTEKDINNLIMNIKPQNKTKTTELNKSVIIADKAIKNFSNKNFKLIFEKNAITKFQIKKWFKKLKNKAECKTHERNDNIICLLYFYERKTLNVNSISLKINGVSPIQLKTFKRKIIFKIEKPYVWWQILNQ